MKKLITILTFLIFIISGVSSHAQSCGTPANTMVSNIKGDSAMVSWDVVSGALNYNVRYKKVSDLTWKSIRTNMISTWLTGLSKSTTYEVQVQADCDKYVMPGKRGMYLTGTPTIIASPTEQDKWLTYAQRNRVNYIALYDIPGVNFSNATQVANLAAFIKKAKTSYGIEQMGVVGENSNTFSDKIHPYNISHTDPLEKFDVYNFEFEFWITSSVKPGGVYCSQYLVPNGFSCDTAGGFKFYMREFKKIDDLARQIGATSETYLGWPNQGQAQQIAAVADRILLHSYRTTDVDVYQYAKNRIGYLVSGGSSINLMPIFSAETDFMGSGYLAANPITKPYSVYSTYFNSETATWKSKVNLVGYQWFHTKLMPLTYIASTYTASKPFVTLETTPPIEPIDTITPPVQTICCTTDVNEPNNKSTLAKDLTDKGTSYITSGTMCPANDEDWFIYKTSSTHKNIKITVGDLPINVNVEVYDMNGNFVAGSYSGGLTTEVIKLNNRPASTKYFIVIYPLNREEFHGCGAYKLTLQRSSVAY